MSNGNEFWLLEQCSRLQVLVSRLSVRTIRGGRGMRSRKMTKAETINDFREAISIIKKIEDADLKERKEATNANES